MSLVDMVIIEFLLCSKFFQTKWSTQNFRVHKRFGSLQIKSIFFFFWFYRFFCL